MRALREVPVLFVGHDASRTGAPLALLHFLRWYRAEVGGPIACLLLRGGELTGDFRSVCRTVVAGDSRWQNPSRLRRLLKSAGLDALGRSQLRRSVLRTLGPSPALVYCNTLDTAAVLDLLPSRRPPLLCYAHEMEFILEAYIGRGPVGRLLAAADRVIACAPPVADNLAERHGYPRDRLDVLPGAIPLPTLPANRASSRRAIRLELGLDESTVLVGAAGAPGWRKGSDLYVQLALAVRRLAPAARFHFLWLGGSDGAPETIGLRHDLRLAGLEEDLTYLPSQPDALRYFQALDIFALVSREDPYPLVCLEAGWCGVPSVCFSGAGGMPDFVGQDAGISVPYLDIPAMAAAVVALGTDPARRAHLGERAQAKAAAHEIGIAGPRIISIMERTLSQ